MPAPAQLPGLSPAGPALFPWDAQRQLAGVQGRVGGAPLAVGTSWYVRVGGDDTNGGTSASLTPERQGTDGTTNSSNGAFSSPTGAFTQADVGKGISVFNSGSTRFYQVTSVVDSTHIVVTPTFVANVAGTAVWKLGGAFATLGGILGNSGSTFSPWWSAGAVNTVYIGAGTYRAVYIQGGVAGVSPVFSYVGDVDGSHTGDAGMVQLTAYTTNDRTLPSASTLLNLNGKSNLTFQNIFFVGGSGSIVTGTASQNITFQDCAFLVTKSVTNAIVVTGLTGNPMNLLVDRCSFMGLATNNTASPMIQTVLPRAAANYDANVTIRNSFIQGGGFGAAIIVLSSGAGAGKGGGVTVQNNSIINAYAGVLTPDANVAIGGVRVVNNFIYCLVGMSANVSGQIVENYNWIHPNSPRTNVAIGANSNSDGSYAPLFHFGQERIWGGAQRPFGEPMAGSPLASFGSDGTQTPLDIRSGPRPTTAARIAAGAFQRGNNYGQTTTTTHTGSSALTVTADGFQDFDVAVDAGAITISAYLRYSSAYTGPLPQLTVLANPQVGVSQTTAVCSTNALNAWEQVSVTVTPTAAGILTVRVVSGDDSGVGAAFADSFAFA